MICPNCNAQVPDGANFCDSCGMRLAAPVSDGAPAAAPVSDAAPAAAPKPDAMPYVAPMPEAAPYAAAYTVQQPKVSRKEFFKSVCDPGIKRGILVAAIILYVCAAASLAVAIIAGSFPIDGILIAAIALWIQLTKSKASAIVAVVLGALECIITSLVMGRFSAWLILAGTIVALIYVLKGDKQWKEYQAS